MKLRYTKRSLAQIDDAFTDIGVRSPQGADNLCRRLLAILTVVQPRPRAGTSTNRPGVFRFWVQPCPYVIDDRVTDTAVIVQRFRHRPCRPVRRPDPNALPPPDRQACFAPKGGVDRLLVDAPCSGTGAWRRNPDARWSTLGAGLETLVPQQASILASAARLVKPGGRLVYATCSLLTDENEAQVEAFLSVHPGFRVVPVRTLAPELTASAHPDHLALTPARHDTDGFLRR